MTRDTSRLTRPVLQMPEFVRDGLEQNGLVDAYETRPAYQRNDYIGWITRAQRPETVQKRLNQMLEELRRGDVYMNMPWRAQRDA